jgi:hypothetical protein
MKSGLWRSGLSIWALVIALINTSLHVKKMFHIVLSRTFKFEKKIILIVLGHPWNIIILLYIIILL